MFCLIDPMQIMPPPQSFNGPFVIVDKLMDVFMKTEIPDDFPGNLGNIKPQISNFIVH